MFLFVYNISLFIIDVVQLLWRSIAATLQAIFYLIVRRPKKPLNGETVLITGASHGLGRELALEFARRGAITVLWDINQDGLEETAERVKKENGKVTIYQCDVSDKTLVQQTAQKVLDEVGAITILVNNAGILHSKPMLMLNHQQIRRIIEVNVMAHFLTLYEFLPKMIEMRHGHVVAIASMAARLGTPNLVPYCASKYAVAGLMESLSEETRYYNPDIDLHFTTVFPAVMDTGLAKDPRIKYPWFTPIIQPIDAAFKIVDGVQRNLEHVYLPNYMELCIRLHALFPRRVQQLITDFIDCGTNPQD